MSRAVIQVRNIIGLIALIVLISSGCVIAHRTPPIGAQFTFEPPATPANARFRVKFFLEHKETDPGSGVTRFVPKGEREVSMASGTPSLYRWSAFRERYEGGIWRGRARVSQIVTGGALVYHGEGLQEQTIPYEAQNSGATLTFRFRLEPEANAANGFRVVPIPTP